MQWTKARGEGGTSWGTPALVVLFLSDGVDGRVEGKGSEGKVPGQVRGFFSLTLTST